MKTLNDRPVAFPEVKDFSKLVKKIAKIKPSKEQSNRFYMAEQFVANGEAMPVGGYCSIQEANGTFRSLYANPSPMVMRHVETKMLHTGGCDSLYFSVNIYKDGTALVQLKYSQILGSSYLAIVDAKTIPS